MNELQKTIICNLLDCENPKEICEVLLQELTQEIQNTINNSCNSKEEKKNAMTEIYKAQKIYKDIVDLM